MNILARWTKPIEIDFELETFDDRTITAIHAEQIASVLDRLRGDRETEISYRENLEQQERDSHERQRLIDRSIAAFELAAAALASP